VSKWQAQTLNIPWRKDHEIDMDEKKRLRHWEKIFFNTEPGSSDVKSQKRLNEIDVLLSELSSLPNNSKVYEGSQNTVLFIEDATSMKSKLKKEKSSLAKKAINSSSLAF